MCWLTRFVVDMLIDKDVNDVLSDKDVIDDLLRYIGAEKSTCKAGRGRGTSPNVHVVAEARTLIVCTRAGIV